MQIAKTENAWLQRDSSLASLVEADTAGLSCNAFRLWAGISRFNQDGILPPSVNELSAKYSMDPKSVREALRELELRGVAEMLSVSDEDTVALLKSRSPSKIPGINAHKCQWCESSALVLEKHHYPVRKRDGGTTICSICASCHSEFHSLTDSTRWVVLKSFPWNELASNIQSGGAKQ